MYVLIEDAPPDWPHPDGKQVLQESEKYTTVRWKDISIIGTMYMFQVGQAESGNTSVLVVARLGDSFEFLELENEDDFEAIEDLYPAVARLIQKGLDCDLSTCAMVRMPDLDTGDRRWFLVTTVDGLAPDLDNSETLARLGKGFDRVIASYGEIGRSIRESPGTLGTMTKGLWRGIKTGFKRTPQIVVEQSLKSLLKIALQSRRDT